MGPDRLWLPTSALVSQPIAEIDKGALVLMRPHGRNKLPMLGFRFDHDDGRFIYPLGGAPDGRGDLGKVLDVTDWEEPAYRVDLSHSVEADLTAPLSAWGVDAPRAGDLVAGEAGAALIARFHPKGGFPHHRPVSLCAWSAIEEKGLDTAFQTWRLRIDVPGGDPLYLDPFAPPAPPSP
ncbi:MAG: hypothetical protein JWP35_1898 [Caulobacter sp.]|nr:hypothetical protein [Caulobacter sp.]